MKGGVSLGNSQNYGGQYPLAISYKLHRGPGGLVGPSGFGYWTDRPHPSTTFYLLTYLLTYIPTRRRNK